MSSLIPPSFAEILRASQKDDLVRNQLTNDISSEILLKILGPRQWLLYKPWIEASIHFAYFALTTLADFQTLGEEYTGILQVTNSKNGSVKIPSKISRLVMIALETFGPLFLRRVFKSNNNPEVKRFVDVFEYLGKFHLLWFYIEETFLQVSKRIVNVHYVKLRPWGGLQGQENSIRWLKLLSLFNGIILLRQLLVKFKSLSKSESSIEETLPTKTISETRGKKCPLCLEPRTNPTSTLCGHIFCWYCIHDSVRLKPECPICREEVNPSRLIPIMNID